MLTYMRMKDPCFLLHMTNTFANELNNDLAEIGNWVFQGKINLNPDLSKQTQEGIFSRKLKKISNLPLVFNNI